MNLKRERRAEATESRHQRLRELEPGPRSALAVLLALLHPGVARQEAFLLQLLAQLQVVDRQRARDPVADRSGLARGAAAGDRDVDVELLGRLGREERLLDDHLEDVVREVVVERSLVDGDRSGARERGGRAPSTSSDARRPCAESPRLLPRVPPALLRAASGARLSAGGAAAPRAGCFAPR